MNKHEIRGSILTVLEEDAPHYVKASRLRSLLDLSEEDLRWHIDYLHETGLIIVSEPSPKEGMFLKLTAHGEDWVDMRRHIPLDRIFLSLLILFVILSTIVVILIGFGLWRLR